MTEHTIPTKAEVDSYLRDRRNWGRWGDKGSAGAINMINDEKRLKATQLVSKGRAVSLSRPFPVEPSPEHPRPGPEPGDRGAHQAYSSRASPAPR